MARSPASTQKVVWGDGAPEAPEAAADAEVEAAPVPKKAAPAPRAAEPTEEELAIAAGAIDLDAPSAPVATAKPEGAAKPERAAEPERATDKAERATGKAERATGKAARAKAPAEEDEGETAPVAEAPAEPSPGAPPPLAELQRRRNERARSEAKDKKASKRAPEPAASAAPAYKGAEPCRAASFSIDKVRSACENGGRPGAKRVMKEAINKATATGQLLKCADCHSSMREYTLESDAVDKLRRWLDG